MIYKIAWRNIWRNKRRTIIVLSSIIVSVIAVIFIDGLSNGMLKQMLFNQINSSISHIQIHKKGFNKNKTVNDYIPDYHKVEKILKNNSSVKYFSERVIVYGLLSSATNSSGVMINGIKFEDEEKISNIKSSIIQGEYSSGENRGIVIGKKLAEKLGAELGDKVVALSTTSGGIVGSDMFRIAGIYESSNSEFDKVNIYISINSAQKMLGIGDNIHEFAIITSDYNKVNEIKEQIKSKLSDSYEVLDYMDLLPMLILQLDMYKESMLIFNLIVGIALIFGITNIMLMAVFERIREFGILKSIGIKSSGLFIMIISEALIIGLLGTMAGIILGILIQIPFAESGINLSVFAESLKSFGAGAIIYPETTIFNLLNLIIMVPLISILAALYPAYKSIKLEPVNAIRYL